MPAIHLPPETCKWCGEVVPDGSQHCPQCGRPAPPGTRPLFHEEPVELAPGQEGFGSWASIKQIFRSDKLFAAVLVLQVLNVVLASVSSNPMFRTLLAMAVLWGLVSFRWWGLWLALIGSALAAFAWLLVLLILLAAGSSAAVIALVGSALPLFTITVLWMRRDRFD